MQKDELRRIYDLYGAALYQFLLALTRNESEARDLLQDVFVKLARTTNCLKEVTDEKNYLYRICRNVAIDRHRGQLSRRARDTETARMRGVFEEAADPDIEQFRQALDTALTELPENQRTIVHLRLWQGWSIEEIAQLEGISKNTAASRYRYAISKLQANLQPLYDDIQ